MLKLSAPRIVALACAAFLAAPVTAGATPRRRQVTAVLENAQFLSDAPECLFRLGFDVVSESGNHGKAVNCIKSYTGDASLNRALVLVHTTVTFDDGSIEADVVEDDANEDFPTYSLFHESFSGTVTGGTGKYKNAQGKVLGGGQVKAGEQGLYDILSAFVFDLRS